MKKTKKTAYSGIFVALTFVVLGLGSVIDVLDLSAAAFSSMITLMAMIELGKAYAFGIYAASSVLSVILLPNKTAAVIYMCFAGFYPLIKVYLNLIKPKVLSFITRFAVFNAFLTLLIFVSTKLFGIQDEFIAFGYLIYILANVTFLCYDLAIEKLSVFYCIKLRGKIFKNR